MGDFPKYNGNSVHSSGGSRIFLRGVPTPKVGVLKHFLAENCMKMKEFGPRWCVPGASLPIRQYIQRI